MNKETKNWTEQEDHALKHLREDQGIKKWSLIALKMQTQFKLVPKSGKKCRDRYQTHLNTEVRREEWTEEEERALFRLHDLKGNKWVQIGKILERSDNAVKNYFHSKMRKALRKINYLISTNFRNEFKPFKNNIISKVLQASEKEPYQPVSSQTHNVNFENTDKVLAIDIKNRFLDVLGLGDKLSEAEVAELRILIKEVNKFSKTFKQRMSLKNQKTSQTEVYPRRNKQKGYKGKEILNLINENKANQARIDQMESQEELSENPIVFQNRNNAQVCLESPNITQNMGSIWKSWFNGSQNSSFSLFGVPYQPFFINYPYYNYAIPNRSSFNYSLYPQNTMNSVIMHRNNESLAENERGQKHNEQLCVKKQDYMEEINYGYRSFRTDIK